VKGILLRGLLLVAVAGGCGSAAREAASQECVVRVYFCRADYCGRAATREQMRRIEARLRGRDDVYSVRFISKEEALRIMKRRHPDAVAILPSNPLPDSLRVRPVKGASLARIAATVHPRREGVHTVNYRQSAKCTV
jgi:cell division protein FtsX